MCQNGFLEGVVGRAGKEGQGACLACGCPSHHLVRGKVHSPTTSHCQGTSGVEDPAPEPTVTTKLPSSMRASGLCLCQLKYTHFNRYLDLASTGLNSPWRKGSDRSQGTCQKTTERGQNSPRTLPWNLYHGTKALVPLSPGLELWSLQDAFCYTLLSLLSRRTCVHQ